MHADLNLTSHTDLKPDGFEDWLAPLYRCAQEHQTAGTVAGLWYAAREYSFLGTYRDSPQRLKECCSKLRAKFDHVSCSASDAQKYLDCVKANMELEQFEQTGIEGYAGAVLAGQERKQSLASAALKRQRKKRKFLAGCAAFAILLVLCSALYVFACLQPSLRKKAAALEAERDYEGAMDVYSMLLIGPWSKQADEKMLQMKTQLGDRYVEEGSYEQALALFQELDDEEGIKKAQAGMGGSFKEQGRFEEALQQFTDYGFTLPE